MGVKKMVSAVKTKKRTHSDDEHRDRLLTQFGPGILAAIHRQWHPAAHGEVPEPPLPVVEWVSVADEKPPGDVRITVYDANSRQFYDRAAYDPSSADLPAWYVVDSPSVDLPFVPTHWLSVRLGRPA